MGILMSEIFCDVCVFKVVHLVDHAYRRLYDGVGTECARPFSQSHAQLQQRPGLHEGEHLAVAALFSAMAENHVVKAVRIEACGGQCTCPHDETVYQHRDMALGSAEHGTDGANHLEAAEMADDFFHLAGGWHGWKRGVAPVKVVNGLLEHNAFMFDTFRIKSGSGSNALIKRDVPQETHPNAGRRGVGNTHFTDTDDVAPFLYTTVYKHRAAVNGPIELFTAHGRLVEEVTGAAGHFAIQNVRVGCEVIVHSHVNDGEVEPVLSAKHVYSSSASTEVDHLLPRDLTGRHAHAFALNAMVASQQQVAGVAEGRGECLLDKPNLKGEFFKSAQRTFGLVQIVYFRLQSF